MNMIHLRALSVGALAFLTFAGGVSAQTTSSAVLNFLEVRELIKHAKLADHARLEVHFGGTRISQAAVHCDRLAALSRDEAKEATEAAAMDKQLPGAARQSRPRSRTSVYRRFARRA